MSENAKERKPEEAAGKPRSCPVCGKPAAAQFRPFCSRHCAHIDLNRWLSGIYRIPTAEPAAEETAAAADAPEEPEK